MFDSTWGVFFLGWSVTLSWLWTSSVHLYVGEGLRVWWGQELRGWINHGRPPLWLNTRVSMLVCVYVCVHSEALVLTLVETHFNQSADGSSTENRYKTEIGKRPWKEDGNRKLQGMRRLFVCIYKKRFADWSRSQVLGWKRLENSNISLCYRCHSLIFSNNLGHLWLEWVQIC